MTDCSIFSGVVGPLTVMVFSNEEPALDTIRE